MLKGIPKILSPQLLKVLCEMGHADRIVISDGNFPAASVGKNGIVVRLDGHGVPEILDAILTAYRRSWTPSSRCSLWTPMWSIRSISWRS